jgi:hypothetical protein
MATQQLAAYNTITVPAGADLSAAQWKFVKLNSSGQAVVCDGVGDQPLGVLCNKPDEAGKAAEVQIGGVAKVQLGGTVTAGDKIMVNASALAVTQTGVNNVAGYALEGGSSGDRRSVALVGSDGTPGGGLETVSAPGAIAPSVYETHLEVDGTDAFTMGDGSIVGQRKRVTCITAANTPLGTVTLNGAQAAFGTEPTAYVFTTVGQFAEWEWTASGWKLVALGQTGAESLAAAATANPLCLLHLVNLDSTNDYIQSAPIVAGQRSIWLATAGTGASTVSGLYYDEDGSADGIDINFNAAGDQAVLSAAGARWIADALVSATIST